MYDQSSYVFKAVEASTVIASLFMIFSGVPTCMEAYRRKDISNLPFVYFLCGTLLSINGLVYSGLLSNLALIGINFVSLVVSFFYIGLYLLLTRCNALASLYILLASFAFCVFQIISYHLSSNLEQFKNYIGAFGSTGSVIMNALPIIEVVSCIRRGDSSAILLPMLIAGTINMFCWIAYGLLLDDYFMIAPNIPAAIVNLLRYIVLAIFPSSKASSVPNRAVASAPTKHIRPAKKAD